MKPPIRSISICLSAITVSLSSFLAQAQKAPDWLPQTEGSYTGEIWSGGSAIASETTFTLNEDGTITGSYLMHEPADDVTGTISACQPVDDLTLQCTWDDIYGTGDLRVTFTEDFSNFDGYWTPEAGLELGFGWNGSR
ncbi:MAG: hypothetical protein AAFV72_07450 [Cyanobacteria bacterium J06635_1]